MFCIFFFFFLNILISVHSFVTQVVEKVPWHWHLSLFVSLSLFLTVSLYLSFFLSFSLYFFLSLSLYLSISLSLYLSLSLPLSLSIPLSRQSLPVVNLYDLFFKALLSRCVLYACFPYGIVEGVTCNSLMFKCCFSRFGL